MSKHAKKSGHLQIVEQPKTTTVEIPLPILEAFGNIENSFFELCFDAGSQVLTAMTRSRSDRCFATLSLVEQDREELCGPRWKRDPERRAGFTTSTRMFI